MYINGLLPYQSEKAQRILTLLTPAFEEHLSTRFDLGGRNDTRKGAFRPPNSPSRDRNDTT